MAKNALLQYYIWLPVKADVDTFNDEVDALGGTNINGFVTAGQPSVLVWDPSGAATPYYYDSPVGSANAFAAYNDPPQALGAVLPEDEVVGTVPAIMTSGWFTTDSNFPWDEKSFDVCTGGWFGVCSLFGDRTNYYWGARFLYNPQEDEDTETGTPFPSTPAAIPERRWFDSFTMAQFGESPSANAGQFTRAATLWPGHNAGFGQTRQTAGTFRTHTITENTGGGTSTEKKSWERLYMRVRSLPTNTQQFWEAYGFPTAADGARIKLTPTGQLAVYGVYVSGEVLAGTTTEALTVDEWTLLDILFDVDAGTLRIYKSHELIGTFTVNPGGSGWNAANVHQGTRLDTDVTNDATLHMEFALWSNANIPNIAGVETLTSADFIRGTRPAFIRATAFGADHGAWTGGFGISMQNFDPAENDVASESTSSTASDVYSVATDAPRTAKPAGAMGIITLNIARYGHRGAGQGELGYKLNSDADVYTALTTEAAGPSKAWVGIMVDLGAGALTEPISTIDALEIKYRKAADTTEGGIGALLAVAEVIGVFDPTDIHPDADTEVPPPLPYPVHNSAYPASPWGFRSDVPAPGPVGLFAGTYTGTGAEFELTFPLPICLLVIRRVTGTSDPNFYWTTSMLSAKDGIEIGNRPDAIKAVRLDPDYAAAVEDDDEVSCIARISADAEINDSGVTFQYFAVADPAARFHLCEAWPGNASMTARALALQDSGFTPEAAMLWAEIIGVTSTGAAWMKGDSLGADEVVPMIGGTALTGALTFGAGQVTLGGNTTVWSSNPEQLAALLVREDDGNGPFDTPPLAIATWTGDGGASRTVAVDLGGKRPLMAWAAGGAAGDGYYRDPSMTTTNSMDPDGGSHQANGITGGGVDSVSVGSDLNASGVAYVMIVWPGSTTAGNGGWSINGDFYPVEPDTLGVSTAPTTSGGTGGGATLVEEPDLDSTTALPGTSLFCEDFTRRLCNIALQRIGVSKKIDDLNNDQTEEASIAREFIKYEIEACLRDFEWNFATAYADLTLVDGSPSDPAVPDFTYSYREPTDSLYVRRIVGQTGQKRSFDPNPIQFRRNEEEGSSGGGLIYTDAAIEDANTPVQIEYTRRVTCPAYFGDSLFRDALIWRFAHAFAPPLTRDTRKTEYCWRQYVLALQVAETSAGNEEQAGRSSGEDADWIRGRHS